MITIEHVRLTIIEMPLNRPFTTHLGAVKSRQSIIVEVMDKDGTTGFGETVAFTSPWYTEETVQTALHIQKDFLIPKLFQSTIHHPNEVQGLFQHVRRNEMAKAGIETAIWDLYAKKKGVPLHKLIGGVREEVAAGAVVATQNISEAFVQIEQFIQQGYQRIKVKIDPKNDYRYLQEIRSKYPKLPIMVDANSAYTLSDIQQLQTLDEFELIMIEQPLAVTDIVEHSILQKQISTPICLDESISSVHDAYSAIELGSCKVINVKLGRVGGITNAIQIHNLCLNKGILAWCGGMIEFGISRAHNIALATLPGFSLPGDFSSSAHYWEQDIIEPLIKVKNGVINVPKDPGIGYSLNRKRLKQVMEYEEIFRS